MVGRFGPGCCCGYAPCGNPPGPDSILLFPIDQSWLGIRPTTPPSVLQFATVINGGTVSVRGENDLSGLQSYELWIDPSSDPSIYMDQPEGVYESSFIRFSIPDSGTWVPPEPSLASATYPPRFEIWFQSVSSLESRVGLGQRFVYAGFPPVLTSKWVYYAEMFAKTTEHSVFASKYTQTNSTETGRVIPNGASVEFRRTRLGGRSGKADILVNGSVVATASETYSGTAGVNPWDRPLCHQLATVLITANVPPFKTFTLSLSNMEYGFNML